ncbi:hypothetical protein [Psychromonas sp. KJ10-2]|uniref:hypothetical protein n=1 Tax=Psychromonas sp. KJ10-2 TaxID=3391822 RepID=UPI0039B544C2
MAKLSQPHRPILDTAEPLDAIIYDVVIVGAGMSGSLLALTLLTQNPQLKVLLLDENAQRLESIQEKEFEYHPSFDARCIALNAGSVDILSGLSLWGILKPMHSRLKAFKFQIRATLVVLS